MEPTSLTLLERVQREGDTVAWARLLRIYGPWLEHWLRGYGLQPQDVSDVAQDILVVVLQRLPEFRHNGRTGAFRTWLRLILVNCLRTFRRRFAALGEDAWQQRLDELADPASNLSGRWDREHDAFVLARLTELIEPEFESKTWQAFQRTVLLGQPTAQVAAELQTTVNAVLLAKSRILQRLREERQRIDV
jgi:RNA polymerase sigma-70 factor (ECF subfamily)